MSCHFEVKGQGHGSLYRKALQQRTDGRNIEIVAYRVVYRGRTRSLVHCMTLLARRLPRLSSSQPETWLLMLRMPRTADQLG